MKKSFPVLGAFLACAALLHAEDSATVKSEQQPNQGQVEFFEKNIRPVLADKCYECHSAKAKKLKGGLLLDTRDGIRHGGETGPAVVPGNLDASLLITALRYNDKDTQMPPQKSGGKLPDDVIALFEQWVKMGAPDPRDGTVKTTAEINEEAATQFWSFQPPRAITPPTVKNTTWPRSDIDRFVLAAMEQKNLRPGAETEPRALLRRVYFDLIGMPPTIAQANAFIAESNKGPEARQRMLEGVVDALLKSRQFGERWGRHWLDVARYAESAGKESNNLFPAAWRYRDYVIDAFQKDKPYDQFIREQIAGDLLKATTAAERNEHLTATAFLAIGTKNIVEKNRLTFKMDMVDEQIDAASRAVIGLTVACARCHDHKYDPITTRDYYALAGIFRSTDTLYGTQGKKNRGINASALLPLIDESKSLSEQPPLAAAAPIEVQKNLKKKKGGKKGGGQAKQTPQQMMHEVMGVRDGAVADCPIYLKGETDAPSAVVPRGVVSVLAKNGAVTMPPDSSGRLQLAEWLTAKENPLTARVMVNRVWQHLFGQGIVRTADNFGATGERPTHPELLDFLAVRFMENGWSVKQLIREIVLSRTYALSTRTDATNAQIDPGNAMLWRANPRRLDAEAIRDAMLTASGMIDLNPPGGSMVGSLGDGLASGYSSAFVNAQFHYRSVYLPIVREFVPSCLGVFDFSEPSLVVTNRDVTNVPSQALYLMNNPFVIEQAKALAHRITAVPNLDVQGRIALAYQRTLGRPPTVEERARADQFLRGEYAGLVPLNKGKVSAAAEDAYTTFCQALFATAEFRFLADSLPNQSTIQP